MLQEPQLQNPTVVVITDRNDLDGQLFGVFSLAQDLLREQPVQAHTRQALRQVLANRPSGGIIFATIQKFTPGEDEDTFPVLSERSNIVVWPMRHTARNTALPPSSRFAKPSIEWPPPACH